MKNLLSILFLLFCFTTNAQTLTISDAGQSGTSGTNWSVSGTNPVTISATNSANINPSVLESYINTGSSVVLETTANVHLIKILNPINKTLGSDVSLTIKSGGRILLQSPISSTVGALDIVLWSDFDNDNNDGGVSVTGNINSNGGHVWIGGSNTSSSSYTWNGLAVGDGPSIGSDGFNWNALDLFASVITNGGDFLAWAGNGYSDGIDGVGSNGINNLVNSGSGDITLITDKVEGSGAQSIKFETTGVFSLVPNGGSFDSSFNWNPSISGNNIDFGAVFEYLGILNFPNLTGLNIGQYSGMQDGSGNSVVLTNVSRVTISEDIAIAGDVKVYANDLLIESDIATSNNGDILLKSLGHVVVRANNNLTTSGGNIILWANTANITSGTNNNEIILEGSNMLTSNSGDIIIAGGLDDGSNGGTANDGIPDGYAYRGGYSGDAIDIRQNNVLVSNGGNILLRGHANPSGNAGTFNINVRGYGIQIEEGTSINSGTGTINLKGLNNSDHAIGFEDGNVALTSASTAETAIILDGETTINFAGFLNGFYQGQTLIQTTAATGGGIKILTQSAGTSIGGAMWLGSNDANSSLQILSQAGDITLSSDDAIYINNQSLYLGNRKNSTPIAGITPSVVNSSGIAQLIANNYSYVNTNAVNVNTTGGLSLLPFDDDFSSDLTINNNLILGSSLSNFTIGKSTTSADGSNDISLVISSGISIAGDIKMYADNIYSTTNFESTTNKDILLKGSGYVVMEANVDLSTNGGDIIFWSNTVNDVSQTSENNEVDLRGNNTITTNGGKIIIAGGLDDGSNNGTANDGIPDGYAFRGFNDDIFAADFGPNVTLDSSTPSGGGDVVIRGSGFGYGVRSTGSFKINSGTGSISISGKSTLSNGIDLNGDAIAITTANTTNNAINIKGETTAFGRYGVILGSGGTSTGNTLIQATGANGAVTINGTSANSVGLYGRENGTLQVLAQSGNINLKGENLAGATNAASADFKNEGSLFYLGNRKDATAINGVIPAVTASSSAIKLQADYLSWGSAEPVLNTAGTFTVESVSDSFSTFQNLESDWFQFTNIGGLTIGKSTNVQNVIINENLDAAGSVIAYGKDITVNSDIAVTTTNNYVFLSASNAILSSAGSITTQDGSVLLNSDSDTSDAGNIVLSLFNIETNGGDITLGGGTNGIGYAVGSETVISGNGKYKGVFLNKSLLDADGGNISIKGKGWQGSPITALEWPIGIDVVAYLGGSAAGTEIKTKGTGTILMDGTGGILNNNDSHNSGVNFYLEASNVTANKKHKVLTETGVITINGASGTGSSTNKKGISFDNGTTHISSTTGNISFNGTTPVNSQGFFVNTSAIATIGSDESSAVTSGNILMAADNLGLAGVLNINSSGTLGIVSINDRFSNDIIIPSFTTNLANTVSGLTIGKTTNTANLTINSTSNIAGPISVYGGDITLNSNVSSSLVNSPILLKATGNITTGNNAEVTTNGGDVTLWADSDASNAGFIAIGDQSDIHSNGGNITLSGGTDLATGFATGSGSNGILIGANTSNSNTTAINSAGGTILMRGNALPNSSGNYNGINLASGTQIDSGTGAIDMYGKSSDQYGFNIANGTAAGVTIKSAKTTGNAIMLEGLSTVSYGLVFNYNVNKQVLATGGGDVIVKGTGAGVDYGIFLSDIDILATSGKITLDAGVKGFTTGGSNPYAIIGSKIGDSNIASSTSDIEIIGDVLGFDATTKFNTTGTLALKPFSNSFASAFTTNGFDISNDLSGLTIGKLTNTANVTFSSATTIAGPIMAYGGDITVAENLNTASGTTNGDILLKGSEDVIFNANKSLTTNGGSVIIWPNSDGQTANGAALFRENSSILTGGGHLWIGGGSGTTTWNGLTVGDGYAVSGTSIQPPVSSSAFSGIYLEKTSINTSGGNVYLAGAGASTHNGIITYAANDINAGSGTITLKAGTGTSAGRGMAVSIHSNFTPGSLTLTSTSTAASAIDIDLNSTSNFGMALEGIMNVVSTNTGGISLVSLGEGAGSAGLRLGLGSSRSGELNVLGTSGNIEVNLGEKGISIQNNISSVSIGGKASTAVENSSSDIKFISDDVTAAGALNFSTSGTLAIEPFGSSFSSTLNTSNLTYTGVTGLTLGKVTNTADIIIGSATTIAGPITAYGDTITLDADLTTTNSGAISLYTDNPLGGLTTARTLTAGGAFKYIPRGTAFTAAITYPIANLTATSTGLTIGNTTNDKNITINADVSGAAGIELYGAVLNINANLVTTNNANTVLNGDATVAAGKYIESNGNFTHEGDITFKSNATATAGFGTLGGTYTSTSGVVKTERYIPAKRAFRFLSPSVTTTGSINANWQEAGGSAANLGTHITGNGGASNGFDVTNSNNPSLFTHDNATATWAAVTNTNVNTLLAGTPYRLMVRGDRTVDMSTNTPTPTVTTLRSTGTLKTGDFSPTLNPAAEGYSFIGNPYQAPVDIKEVLAAATDVNATVVYYWDPTINVRGGWVARNLTADTNDVTSSFNEFIQPNQAVFVKNNASVTAPALTFTEANKDMTEGTAGVFRTNNNDIASLRVKLMTNLDSQLQEIDGALVLFNEDYSWEVTDQDITKMGNLDEQVSFKINNTELAIASQNLPIANAVLPISFTKSRQESYQLQFELVNYNGLTPYLFDVQNQSYTEIENGTSVAFSTDNLSATAIESRFSVVFAPSTLDTNTFEQNIALFPNPAKANQMSFTLSGVDTNSEITLFNTLGQQIATTVNVSNNSIIVKAITQLQTGVYIVNIKSQGKQTSVKWIIE